MCDYELMHKMQGLQVRVDSLTCNPGPSCWCNNLSFRLPIMQTEDCLSPNEMLDLYKQEMTEKDVRYLTSLQHRKFVRG